MEGALCPVCAEFEPQTWRKSLCKNCFHGLDEHTDDEDGSQERGARTAKSDSSPAETQPKTVSKEPTKQTQKGGAGTSSVTKQEPASQPSPKSTKTTSKPSATAALSAKFGPSVGKSRDSVKNDAGKSAGKPLSTPAPEPPSPAKSSPELTKRGHTTPARQTTDVRGTSKYTGTDRKQNGSDPKLKTNGSKGVSSTSAKTCTDSKKPGDVKQETRSHSSEAGQTSKTDNIKPVGRAASGVSKVKHLLKSFGSEDEAPDVHIEKKEPKETGRVGEKPATLSDSDVTTKCQAVEKKDTFSKSSISSTVREHHGTKAAHEFGLSFAAKPSTGNGKTAKSIGKRDNGTQVHSAKSPVPGSTAASRRLVDSKVDDKTEGEFKGKVETKLKVESKDLKSKEQDAKSKEKEIKDSKDREQELKDLRAKEEELKDLRIKIHEFQAKEKELQDLRVRDQELKAKEKELTSLKAKVDELKNLQSKEQELKLKEKEFKELKAKENELRDIRAKERDLKSKEQELKTQELEGKKLKSKFAEMEERCKKLSEENETLKKRAHQNRKEEMERLLSELRGQLSTMETRCAKVETDNAVLLGKLKEQEACVKKDQHGSKELGDLEQKLMDTEDDCEDLTEENLKLKDEIVELRKEMDEMYDGFRENEVEEFRDLQKELELTAKNCRILQFKLRKAERKNEQVEADRMHYEDRLRLLQNQFESEETRTHIQALEEELRMAKEVSVRLHDELDIVEDKRSKADEENRHLTGLLEQTDKKQFRMEMEIDKLRDQIMDLKNELKYASSNKSESSERKTPLGAVGKQGSSEYDVSQLMRDLYDSIERENDLKEQLRFTEEETKMMRKKLGELEEENEGLNLQIRKMSSRTAKKKDGNGEDKDSDEESLISDVEMKLQLELLEQELIVSQKKISDMEQDNENLQEEVKFLQQRLEEKTHELSVRPEPSSPNAYYEDKIKQMSEEADDMRWKIIEKEREKERLCAQVNVIQHTRQRAKLKKSKSLDSDYQLIDLKKQLETLEQEAGVLRDKLAGLESHNERLSAENQRLRLQIHRQIPSIHADDAAVENIELKDKVKKLDDENRSLHDKIKTLTESLQTLTRNIRPRQPGVPDIPSPCSPDGSRDAEKQLELVEEENTVLRRKMAELETENSRLSREQGKMTTEDETKSGKQDDYWKKVEGESRVKLMEKILDMEEEIDDLLFIIKNKDEDKRILERDIESFKKQLDEDKDSCRKKELELQQEIDMMHDKNTVLSNLLDIVSERADKAEQELEQYMKEAAAQSERSASAVSALSNASVGSDDVFLTPPLMERPIIHRDWDNQIKKRVESLERLLAEERLKTSTAAKKLSLLATESLSSAMSDDSKLHLREKELLQEEMIEHQKHLKIATDQIQGLRERLHILEEEHHRLKIDYGKVCDEVTRLETEDTHSDKTPEGTIEQEVALVTKSSLPPLKIPMKSDDDAEKRKLLAECAKYKLKCEELEYKVEEIHDIWRSKSAASEKEKRELEQQLQQKSLDAGVFQVTLNKLKDELCEKEKSIAECETLVSEKSRAISRRDEILKEQDEVIKQRDQDFQTLLDQISQREENIRELHETLRTRDERLREKDDIICKLNDSIDGKQRDIKMLSDKIKECTAQLNEKEAVISVLQQQISHNTSRDTGGETDIEKENSRLKESLKMCQCDLEIIRTEKESVEQSLEKSRRALDEAMLLWDKDKTSLEAMINIAEEKLRMYEVLPSMGKSDVVDALKSDAQNYFREKEKLACELHTLRKEHETSTKGMKEQNAKLHQEFSHVLQQLKQEVDTGNKLQQEVDRLKAQAEMAYRLQQEERVLRAEYLAMKVRYETRFEKMSKDYSKMIATVEKLQKERDLDREIISGIQRGMSQLKDNYTQDLLKWEDDKLRLERQLKEIEESRELAEELRRKVQDFKERISDQERLRAEMINKFATERSSWDIHRANMQSRMNQMEEQLSTTSRAQTRAKDIQINMECAWEKERTEQKRLLEEAHNLALDLQEQLRSRDESFSQERKELVRQFESERQSWTKEKREKDRKLSELESCGKRFVALQKRFKELQDKSERDHDVSLRERNDTFRRLAKSRHAHATDMKRVEEILSSLIRLRELGTLISSEGHDVRSDVTIFPSTSEVNANVITSESYAECHRQDTKSVDQTVIKYIKEALVHITKAADALSKHSSSDLGEATKIRRSLSSSELDLLKDELAELKEGEDVFVIPDREKADRSHFLRSGTYDSSTSGFVVDSDITLPPITTHMQIPKLNERPPSYVSGTHSAHTSRSASPDAHTHERTFSPVQKITNYPDPPPSFIIPFSSTPGKITAAGDVFKPSRPKTLTKSISMDSAPPRSLSPEPKVTFQCISAGTTPTEPPLWIPQFPPVLSQPISASLSLSPPQVGSLDRLSPRSARRKFFEERPISEAGFLSWPERKHTQVKHQKQTSLPDPTEVRKIAEEDYTSLLSKVDTKPVSQMKPSVSWDEKMHFRVSSPTDAKPSTFSGQSKSGEPTTTVPAPQSQTKPTTAKEKRRFFKKSSSLESPVGSSLAKVGMQVMPHAAPTGFTPTDIIANVKGKLKSPFKKSKEGKTTERSPSPSSPLQTVPGPFEAPASPESSSTPMPFHEDSTVASEGSTSETQPTSDQTQPEGSSKESRPSRDGARSSGPKDPKEKKWRSRSAERPPSKPIILHADVINPMQVWKFSETAV